MNHIKSCLLHRLVAVTTLLSVSCTSTIEILNAPEVVVTVQPIEDVAPLTLIGKHENTPQLHECVIHYTCFGAYEDNEHNNMKEKCCSEIITKNYRDNVEPSYDNCLRIIAKVPKVQPAAMGEPGTTYPLFYMSVMDHLSSSDMDIIERRLYNESFTFSPFHRHELNYHSNLNDIATFEASLDSILSKDGGIHRPLQHTLALSLPSQITNNLSNREDVINEFLQIIGEVIIFFPISKDYFLDLDDPFQDEHNHACKMMLNSMSPGTKGNQWVDVTEITCNIEVLTSSNAVVDIEQPSFASSQHVVAFRITYNAKVSYSMIENHSSLSIEICFVPVIHFRYQSPILINHINKLKHIKVLSPFLYSGTMNSILHLDGNQHINSFILDTSHQRSTADIITVEVACGLDKHHDLVMIATIATCIIGALQMLRNLSKVGRWY